MTGNAARIRAFDWLRGIAVLFMIQTHALVLLRPERLKDAFYPSLNFFDQLVAPAFIFSAGFSLSLVQVRGAAAGTRGRRVRKTLRRIGEVLAVATLVNWMWFPIFSEPKWLIRMDILQCIGFSLLLALPLLAGLATRPRLLGAFALGLGLALFAITPPLQQVSGPFAGFLNKSNEALFPLLPWAGYVFLGASAGAVAATGERRWLVGWLVGLWALAFLVWRLGPVLTPLYPEHLVGANPAEHCRRVCHVVTGVLGLLAFEHLTAAKWKEGRALRFIEVFGTSSLAAYFFHEALLFKRLFGFSFEAVWGKSLDWGRYTAVLALLIACTFVLTWLTDRVYRAVNARLERPSHGAPRDPRPKPA
jgi:uncharacterized membrane protein